MSDQHPASCIKLSFTLQCPKYEALDQSPNRSSDLPTNAGYPMQFLLSNCFLAPYKAVVVPRLEERTCSSILNFEGYICPPQNFMGIRRDPTEDRVQRV